MRTKNFVLILCLVILSTLVFIILGPAGQQNDSFKTIVTQTHQHLREFQENLRSTDAKSFEIDQKYLSLLGFTSSIYNGTKSNFTFVTYVQAGQLPSVIQLSQNIASKFPSEYLFIYDLGISEDETRILLDYCNNSKCSIISYDLSLYPSHVKDHRMHAYRPLVIKDALIRSKSILFIENIIRLRGSSHDIYNLLQKSNGILGWTTQQAVSTRTHPKMFEYFHTDSDNFLFLRMISLDWVIFLDTDLVNNQIMLPWIKCALTVECIDPIGAQSGGCKFNKKPLYRYSGCHAYDTSAFNIVVGLAWQLEESKFSLPGEINKLFYQESLDEATKVLDGRRRNNSVTSEHPFTVN